MADFVFLTGQAASALLLLYGGYLALFYWIAASPAFAESAPDRCLSCVFAVENR